MINHQTGDNVPYSFWTVCGLFNVPHQYCETGPTIYRPYPRRLESLTICRCHYKGSTFSSVILRPWVLVRSRFEPATSRTAVRCSTNWAIRIYDFTFGLKKNKFENWRSWDCKENWWNSLTWAVLFAETHRFYKQQPVQGAICGPYTGKLNSWKNAVIQQHTLVIFSQTNEILENRDVEPFSLIVYYLLDFSDLLDSELLNLEPWELQF